jgi:hypothetical protein
MSYIAVRVLEASRKGDILSFDDNLLKWTIAQNNSKMIGVLLEDPLQDETDPNIYWGKIVFNGIAYVKASRQIPDCGGFLDIEDGKVFTTESANRNLILPNTKDQSLRDINDMVMILIS